MNKKIAGEYATRTKVLIAWSQKDFTQPKVKAPWKAVSRKNQAANASNSKMSQSGSAAGSNKWAKRQTNKNFAT